MELKLDTLYSYKGEYIKIDEIYEREKIMNATTVDESILRASILRALFKYPSPIVCKSNTPQNNQALEELNLKTVLFKNLYINVQKIYRVTYYEVSYPTGPSSEPSSEPLNEKKRVLTPKPPPIDYKDDKEILRNPLYIFDTEKEKIGVATEYPPVLKGTLLGGGKTRKRKSKKRKQKSRKFR